MVTALLLLTTSAAAGPFTEEGEPQFGPARSIRHRPDPSCDRKHERGVRWACPVTIAGIGPLTAYMMVSHHRFTGVMAVGTVSRLDAAVLLDSAERYWGPGTAMADGSMAWRHGDVVSSLLVAPISSTLVSGLDDRATIRLIEASASELGL